MDANSQTELKRGVPIVVSGLTKRYRDRPALSDIELDIRAGEFLTLLGPSGSGKTTLLMTIAGFTRPDAGSIRFGAREMILAPPHKRNIGMVFQSYALFPHMSVAENVGFALRVRGLRGQALAGRVKRVLDLVELPEMQTRRVDQLSGGQRQRVALARAVIFEPDVLLMDEPLSALDQNLREKMQIELRSLHRRLGITTVYVTHDQHEALCLSDRIAVLSEGRIAQIDEPSRVYEQPLNQFVASFMGQTNFLPVEVRNGAAYFDDRPIRSTRAFARDGAYVLLLRPELLRLASEAVPAGDANAFHADVLASQYQGEQVCVLARISGIHEIQFWTARGQPVPQPGTRVTLCLAPADVNGFPAGDAKQ